MPTPNLPHPLTGVAIPVSALRTNESCAVGEFLDLIPFADFCKKTRMGIIQLLPVNDTGTESSPYSALSAFALHPLHVRLEKIPGAKQFAADIIQLKSSLNDERRFNYTKIREAKLTILQKIFDSQEEAILKDKDLETWIAANPWVREYAVFMNLKRRNFDASWKEWDKMRNPSYADILERWDSPARKSAHIFFAWIQMQLDLQFLEASSYCKKSGILLKGDIPILMNEDSCDAWAHPEFFRDDLRAGSPPDGMNPQGQNWGFPIYNWDNLETDGFKWWKNRVSHCARYYDAYRIDHILGFFRIWSIPSGECTGYLGWTTPHAPITEAELAERGFSGDRLRWLSEPHVPTRAVEEVNNYDYLGSHGIMQKLLKRIGSEELWLFKDTIKGEKDIWNADISEPIKGVLAAAWKNRLFQRTGRNEKGKALFAPLWAYKDTTAWASLNDGEKRSIETLIEAKRQESEALWKEQAEKLLGLIASQTSMVACAEDLGSIPDCVPETLHKLGILGLKVIRWERVWNEYGKPFKDIGSYPELSVATTSVHDSSTLRQWWEGENGGAELMEYFNPEQGGKPAGTKQAWQKNYTPETARWLIGELSKTSSLLYILPIQDYLDMTEDLRSPNAEEDRVNVPGTVTGFNWTYRLPHTIETLMKHKGLIEAMHCASRGVTA